MAGFVLPYPHRMPTYANTQVRLCYHPARTFTSLIGSMVLITIRFSPRIGIPVKFGTSLPPTLSRSKPWKVTQNTLVRLCHHALDRKLGLNNIRFSLRLGIPFGPFGSWGAPTLSVSKPRRVPRVPLVKSSPPKLESCRRRLDRLCSPVSI